ncbi:MAG TPA: SRPBCC family protein [Acidimicrobiales bacterium]
MKRTFSSVTKIVAPREVVWRVMTDHVRYARWGRAKTVTMERTGSPDPNGVGAIRVFHAGPSRVREEVVVYEPPVRMAYRLVSGLPVRDYRSEMVLEVDRDVTVLSWSSSFEPRIPFTGGMFTRLMARAVDGFAAGIKRESEQEASAGTAAGGRA